MNSHHQSARIGGNTLAASFVARMASRAIGSLIPSCHARLTSLDSLIPSRIAYLMTMYSMSIAKKKAMPSAIAVHTTILVSSICIVSKFTSVPFNLSGI